MALSALPKPSSRTSRSSTMTMSSRRPSTQRPYHSGVENDHHETTAASGSSAARAASSHSRPNVSPEASTTSRRAAMGSTGTTTRAAASIPASRFVSSGQAPRDAAGEVGQELARASTASATQSAATSSGTA